MEFMKSLKLRKHNNTWEYTAHTETGQGKNIPGHDPLFPGGAGDSVVLSDVSYSNISISSLVVSDLTTG